VIARASAACAIGIGFVVLVGWILDIDVLKSAGSTITMKTNAAIALTLCGLSLWLVSAPNHRARTAGALFAAIAGALGAATLCQHLFGWDLGIDQALFTEEPGAAATASPNRMGPNASLSFTLLAAALVTLHRFGHGSAGVVQSLVAVVGIFSLVPITGYVYGASELYAFSSLTGIAWHTAVSLLVLSTGIAVASSRMGPLATVFSEGAGGILLRSQWRSALLLPFAAGFVFLAGHRLGLYDAALGFALFSVALTVLLSTMVWRTAQTLDAFDLDRTAALKNERSARTEAESAMKLKDEFLAVLSHELRTPLNAAMGWAQLLRDDALPPNQKVRAIDVIVRNGERLAKLVEDLLDLSRISTGHLELRKERIDVTALAETVIESFRPAAEARGLVVEIATRAPHYVFGDSGRLQQIVRNLLSNSLKFTDAGGRITVSIHERGDTIELRVTDTGTGIDAAFLPHAFERFRQGDGSSTREHGGLGLGLAIVRDLTALHDGAVGIASDGIGQGTAVTVTLPRHSVQPASTSATRELPPQPSGGA
jgi:signal transduction histidine kinase